jgi:hypothetical protein
MNILTELNTIVSDIGLPVETGAFTDPPPDEYAVLSPIYEDYPLSGDNKPLFESQEVRVSLFTKSNYLDRKGEITQALLDADFTVTARRYVGYETDTGYHNIAIDVAKIYSLNEEG